MVYSLQEFLETKKTKGSYMVARSSLVQFLHFVYADSEEDPNVLSLRYLNEGRSYFDDLQGFISYLVQSNLAPNTVHNRYKNVNYWLKWNERILTLSQMAILKTQLPRKVTIHDEADITREILVSLLNHSDVLMRAVILVLSSSGMRIGECLAFCFEQIQGKEIHFTYQQMKSRKPHVYFISDEALQAVSEWVKVRAVRLEQAQLKTKKCLGWNISDDDSRVFPFSYQTVAAVFISLQKAAGCYEFDSGSGRSRRTLHGIRKWTDSTMKMHLSVNLANALIGHFEPGDTAYRRYTREQLREAYAKVEPHLVILAPVEYAELASDTQKQLASHDKLLLALVEEKVDMQKRMDTLERLLKLG